MNRKRKKKKKACLFFRGWREGSEGPSLTSCVHSGPQRGARGWSDLGHELEGRRRKKKIAVEISSVFFFLFLFFPFLLSFDLTKK